MNSLDRRYLSICNEILNYGNKKDDRTGDGTISVFAREIRHDLSEGFPILTTKKVHFKSVVHELLFFLSGATNTKYLTDNNVTIWKEWTTPEGEIGALYGHQWRFWRDSYDANKSIDQIAELINTIKTNPNSRRMIVSAWNVSDLPIEKYSAKKNAKWGRMALPPCHYSFQCYVDDGKLSMIVNQRSCDMFLGVPFNIASYALLTHLLAQVTDLGVGELIWRGGDCHIYNQHKAGIEKQIGRFNDGEVFDLPELELNESIENIDDFTFDDIGLVNYQNAGTIKGRVSI